MLDRRKFILAGLGSIVLLGCERQNYIRPAGELYLGTVRELLYNLVHVRSAAALVVRDANGWRALSCRCTYNGCDLSYQDPILLCPCCKSHFAKDGRVVSGAAKHPLPWMEISFRDGRLYADPGKIVKSDYRFLSPEIEKALKDLRERFKVEGIGDEIKIPEILKGAGDGDPSPMFLDQDPNFVHDLEMIK